MGRTTRVRAAAWSLLSIGVTALAFGSGSCADAEPIAERERVGEVQLAGSTGVCDSNPPTSTQACIDAVQAAAGIVNDVFTDSNGLTADQLPVFGTLFNNWPGCNTVGHAGCAGQSLAPFDCPINAQYTCLGGGNTFAEASAHTNALDRLWWHPCRLQNHTLNGNCPDWTCVANGTPGGYFPWEGLVFDLGGPSNKVAIFAQNDHGPQPCESLEYTVYLTDDPFSTEAIIDPAGDGVDPSKWNRAVLSQVFTKGFVEVRAPDPVGQGVTCGDTSQYSVEQDSFAQVFALPCGITFRYAAVIAGNDGLDFPECAFDSDEAELDAVAGLTESGAGVCPDEDDDNYVDCACLGAPAVCDCVDTDASINPGAPEPCDSVDVNCDGNPGSCDPGLVCYQSVCVTTCQDENASCPEGSECQNTSEGTICVPVDCSVAGCPDGSVCIDDQCVPACTDVVCPGEQICQDGACIDPCQDITCPPGLVCQGAECVPQCACYADDIGCQDLSGTVCDKGGTDLCVSPLCQGVTCTGNQFCDPTTGMCIDFCHSDVQCPLGQKCVDPDGCVPNCQDVMCEPGFTCNDDSGDCEDNRCVDVTCFPPFVCVEGECVDSSGSSGAGGDGGGGTGTGNNDSQIIQEEPGCNCRVGQKSKRDTGAWWLVLLGAAYARRRRLTT